MKGINRFICGKNWALKCSVRALIAALLLSFSHFIAAYGKHEPGLTFITEDWAPYNYREAGELKGFSIEIIQAVMDELGEQYPIMFLPGPRGEQVLATEQNIMSFSLFRTPEREDKYKWIGPISTQSVYFYKQKDNPKTYSTIDDIKGASLITVPHRGLVTDHVGALGITNVLKISSREKQFSLLFSGRAELVVNVAELGLPYYLKLINKPSDSLVKTQVKLLEFPLYIACSKDIPDEVIQRWQKALDRVKASPKYNEIYTRYLHSR